MSEPTPDLWYAALASPYGVIIKTDDPVSASRRLYAIRKSLRDPDLECVSIMTSPFSPETEIWLVKRGGPNETQGEL